MSFALRRKIVSRSSELDLQGFLARIAATQAASPTAVAQARLDSRPKRAVSIDPRVELFSESGEAGSFVPEAAAFAPLDEAPFSPGQRS